MFNGYQAKPFKAECEEVPVHNDAQNIPVPAVTVEYRTRMVAVNMPRPLLQTNLAPCNLSALFHTVLTRQALIVAVDYTVVFGSTFLGSSHG